MNNIITEELSLVTQSNIVSTNLKTFEEQADRYIQSLTSRFETDDDFALAKGEIKELETLEKRTRAAIESVKNGEIAELIAQAEAIAERFRSERLMRTKLVKERETEIKAQAVKAAFDEVLDVRLRMESDVSLALEIVLPKLTIQRRLADCAKGTRTITSLQKALHAEKTALLAEIAQENARIAERNKKIPLEYDRLFADRSALIADTSDIEPIIQARIEKEKARQAQEQKVREEAAAIAQEMEQQAAEKPQENAKTAEPTEPAEDVFNFLLQIPFTGTVAQARAYFEPVKSLNYQGVRLTKLNS